MKNLPKFTLDQMVTWSSQAAGCWKEKKGPVAQVVPPKGYPDRDRFPHLYRNAGVGSSRDHESYVILVGKIPYWPRVSSLKAAE